ncbi:hypothetical protein AT302_17790 [Pandoraea norimbergensis]|uniref:Uncharacterized protein n=1 Tax=Pandoraea norimbergensis TaxID=93219 RepID=A0ABN4JML3_9BURK|nr:hypothetical protein AT302_17790 [Pandoraea norimbergensis]
MGLHFVKGSGADELAFQVNVDYVQLVAGLLNDNIVSSRAILNALSSVEGRRYISLSGHRASELQPLAEAWASLLHELLAAGVPRAQVLSLLIRMPAGGTSFFVELLNAPRVPNDCRRALFNRLSADNLMPTYREIRQVEGRLGAMILTFRLRPRRQTIPPISTTLHAVEQVIDHIREAISEHVVLKLEADHLSTRLREIMPYVTINEQRALREMVIEAVQTAWSQVLPGETPPRKLPATSSRISARATATASSKCVAGQSTPLSKPKSRRMLII